jgi:hypothetical protein
MNFHAILTNPNGTQEHSPEFPTQSGLCLWLATHRKGRACQTNIVAETTFFSESGIREVHRERFSEPGARALRIQNTTFPTLIGGIE